jgi:hypothetical protein
MNHLLISQHVIFDESSFPFASSGTPPDDLDSLFSSSPAVRPIASPYPSSIAGTLEPDVAPHVAPAPPPSPGTLLAQPAPHTAPAPPLWRSLGFTLHRGPPGVPVPWIVYNSPPPPLPRHSLWSQPLSAHGSALASHYGGVRDPVV